MNRLFMPMGLLLLVGCAAQSSLHKAPSLAEQPPQETSPYPNQMISQGSLMLTPLQPMGQGRGLFEERRAQRPGDTLTVVLNETTQASKGGGTKANRQSNSQAQLGLGVQRANTAGNPHSLGVNGQGQLGFDAQGSASASNQFSGTITVSVLEVLPNGNLRVRGQKYLAIGAEEEVIQFSGIVSPLVIQGNTVLSSQVASARIEYRGAGVTDEVQRAGWLQKAMMKFSPQ